VVPRTVTSRAPVLPARRSTTSPVSGCRARSGPSSHRCTAVSLALTGATFAPPAIRVLGVLLSAGE